MDALRSASLTSVQSPNSGPAPAVVAAVTAAATVATSPPSDKNPATTSRSPSPGQQQQQQQANSNSAWGQPQQESPSASTVNTNVTNDNEDSVWAAGSSEYPKHERQDAVAPKTMNDGEHSQYPKLDMRSQQRLQEHQAAEVEEALAKHQQQQKHQQQHQQHYQQQQQQQHQQQKPPPPQGPSPQQAERAAQQQQQQQPLDGMEGDKGGGEAGDAVAVMAPPPDNPWGRDVNRPAENKKTLTEIQVKTICLWNTLISCVRIFF